LPAGAVLGALLGLGLLKKRKMMSKLEKTLISLVRQLFEYIEKLDAEVEEAIKRPSVEQHRALKEEHGRLQARKNDADREISVLQATLADRDKLIEALKAKDKPTKRSRR
jgi:hypothetical protein